MTIDPVKSVEGRIALATAKHPSVAAILADEVHGGWMGNEMPIDAIIGDDAELRQAIWEYSLTVKCAGDPGYFRKNAQVWYGLLCIEQTKRVNGDKCDTLTEYACSIWKASFVAEGGTVAWHCDGCAQGVAHAHQMKREGMNNAPIDGMTGGR